MKNTNGQDAKLESCITCFTGMRLSCMRDVFRWTTFRKMKGSSPYTLKFKHLSGTQKHYCTDWNRNDSLGRQDTTLSPTYSSLSMTIDLFSMSERWLIVSSSVQTLSNTLVTDQMPIPHCWG